MIGNTSVLDFGANRMILFEPKISQTLNENLINDYIIHIFINIVFKAIILSLIRMKQI